MIILNVPDPSGNGRTHTTIITKASSNSTAKMYFFMILSLLITVWVMGISTALWLTNKDPNNTYTPILFSLLTFILGGWVAASKSAKKTSPMSLGQPAPTPIPLPSQPGRLPPAPPPSPEFVVDQYGSNFVSSALRRETEPP